MLKLFDSIHEIFIYSQKLELSLIFNLFTLFGGTAFANPLRKPVGVPTDALQQAKIEPPPSLVLKEVKNDY